MRMSLCTLALALALPACAGEPDALRKELESLRQEVGRIRAENNVLTARLETLELTRERRAPEALSVSSEVSAESDRPSLDVVHLAPGSGHGPADDTVGSAASALGDPVDADEPRPVLRSTGRGEVITQSAPPRPAKPAKGTPR